MKMVKITEEQAIEITNQEYSPGSLFNPVQDINGDWFVSEIERGLGSELFPWLTGLEAVDFIPVPLQR